MNSNTTFETQSIILGSSVIKPCVMRTNPVVEMQIMPNLEFKKAFSQENLNIFIYFIYDRKETVIDNKKSILIHILIFCDEIFFLNENCFVNSTSSLFIFEFHILLIDLNIINHYY